MKVAAADPEGFYFPTIFLCMWVAAVERMPATKGQFFGLEAYPIECLPLASSDTCLVPNVVSESTLGGTRAVSGPVDQCLYE